jgi:hypothetical protein
MHGQDLLQVEEDTLKGIFNLATRFFLQVDKEQPLHSPFRSPHNLIK